MFRGRVVENSRAICKQRSGQKMERLREWMEDGEEGVRVLVGGDFNVRTGREEGRMREE